MSQIAADGWKVGRRYSTLGTQGSWLPTVGREVECGWRRRGAIVPGESCVVVWSAMHVFPLGKAFTALSPLCFLRTGCLFSSREAQELYYFNFFLSFTMKSKNLFV